MEENSNVLDSHTVYKEALYYICTLLIPNMEYYLEEEGRYYGRVKSYLDSIKLAKSQGEELITDQDKQNYGKILSIIRGQIKKDFSRLGNRRMSCADRIIIIIRWLLKIVDFIPLENYKFQKQALTFSRIIEHLFDNIRNHSKKDVFNNMTKLIERAINNGEFSDTVLLSINLVNSTLANKKPTSRSASIQEELIKESNQVLSEIDFSNNKIKETE